ncbi:MAG: response regulator [Pseudomonadales bacterium]|nr:response regulator [Pseudomonadales bacterium]
MIHVAVVEDDPLAAELLTDYISNEDMKVVRHYQSAEQALEEIPRLPLPDVLLMDIGLPGVDGIEATQRLKQQFEDLEVLMLTTFEDTETIIRAIKAGASGYMLKASRSSEICDAIREIKRGGSTLSGSVARKLVNEFQHESVSHELEALTDRENDILGNLIEGGSYKAIADQLDISVHTVNNHIRHIYKKLHVNSRAEAVAIATGSGAPT